MSRVALTVGAPTGELVPAGGDLVNVKRAWTKERLAARVEEAPRGIDRGLIISISCFVEAAITRFSWCRSSFAGL